MYVHLLEMICLGQGQCHYLQMSIIRARYDSLKCMEIDMKRQICLSYTNVCHTGPEDVRSMSLEVSTTESRCWITQVYMKEVWNKSVDMFVRWRERVAYNNKKIPFGHKISSGYGLRLKWDIVWPFISQINPLPDLGETSQKL